MCSLQLSKHTSTKWLTVAPPYIPDVPLNPGFVQVKVYNLPRLAKRLGGWVRANSWRAMESYRNLEEGPFKHASHLRWQPEEFLSYLRG
jgi:hypothetical protein